MYSVIVLIPKKEKAASFNIFNLNSLSYTNTGEEIE